MSIISNLLSGYRIKVCILLALFILAYWVPLHSMAAVWYSNEDYSYGFMIPGISAYLLWERRKELAELPIQSSYSILPLLLLFVMISIYGILGSSGNISMPVTPILVLLFFAFCFGIEGAKRLILPLGFLFFMTPIPPVLERTIGLYLRSISSKVGGGLIRMMGQSVHVSGNVIDLGVTQLQVADACSGLRYIFPLLALGILYAYFFEKVLWKRIFCVFATLPIAILTNTIRIGATGLLIPYYGVAVAEGFFHDFSGWLIFLVAFAFLFILGRVLRLFPPSNRRVDSAPPALMLPHSKPVVRADISPAFYTACAILIGVAALSLSTSTLPPVKLQGGIASFPLKFEGWQGRPQVVDFEIIEKSGAEEAFSGVYTNSNADESVALYIGFRSTAFLSNENFFHSPTVCLPASGMEIKEEGQRLITGVPFFNELTVSTMVIENLGSRHLVYYWFQTKDQASPDKNINRYHLALHAIRRDNTHDLFIRPITAIQKGEGIHEAELRMDGFVRDMMGALMQFLQDAQVSAKEPTT